MMKRMVLATLLGMFCLGNNLSAMDLLRNRIIDLGKAIEKVDNVPLIDKLTNLLPFAMVAACFKECPGQTLMVLAGLLFYVVSKNESVRPVLNKYKSMGFARFGINQEKSVEFDDTLFVFDGEDEEDAQEENDMEDELFAQKSDGFKTKKGDLKLNQPAEQAVIKFL